MSDYGKTFTARYGGSCGDCGGNIAAGAQVRYRYNGGKTLCHAKCENTAPGKMIGADAPYKLNGGSGYGCNGWTTGQVVRVDLSNPRRAGWPAYVTVVISSKCYYREDGLSFGVGDDRGYTYAADCRESTAEEIAPCIESDHAAAIYEDAKRDLARLVAVVAAKENYAPGQRLMPAGDILMDTATIYGGGDWWVVGADGIWYVQNNGSDGDDWSRNNVLTGGAGAVGYRVDYTDELAGRLRSIAGRLA
jgi:hypothetical protein